MKLESRSRGDMKKCLSPHKCWGLEAGQQQALLGFLLAVTSLATATSCSGNLLLPSKPPTVAGWSHSSHGPRCFSVSNALCGRFLFLRCVLSTETTDNIRRSPELLSSADFSSTSELKASGGASRSGLTRLRGFSLLLNPDACTNEQQLERM